MYKYRVYLRTGRVDLLCIAVYCNKYPKSYFS